MDYARIRTQVSYRPTGQAIYVRSRRYSHGLGQGDAPPAIDLTNLFNESNMPSALPALNQVNPLYYPSPAGPIVPSSSTLYPLTIPAPGMTPQSALQTAGQTLASLLAPKPATAAAAPSCSTPGVACWFSQSSGVGGLSNQVLIGGALALGIVAMLIARRH